MQEHYAKGLVIPHGQLSFQEETQTPIASPTPMKRKYSFWIEKNQ